MIISKSSSHPVDRCQRSALFLALKHLQHPLAACASVSLSLHLTHTMHWDQTSQKSFVRSTVQYTFKRRSFPRISRTMGE